MANALWAFIVLAGLFLYFIPTFNAWGKNQFSGVLILNIILGWTLIGWIIAFIWSYGESRKELRASKLSTADELTKLNDLKQKGVLNDQEFETQKNKILNQ